MSGSWLQLLYYLVIAFVIGTIAQILTGYQKRKIFTTLVLGFIGVICGDLVARYLNVGFLPKIFGIDIFWSTVGAVVFILAYRVIRGRW
jgi:uncharacterized membrane protein YeaQ/YmgE (transglycosylase-associated protein family)